jgi:hypothetical protein
MTTPNLETQAALVLGAYHAVRDADATASNLGLPSLRAVRAARYALWHDAVAAIEAALRATMDPQTASDHATIHRLACHLVDTTTAATIADAIRLAPDVARALVSARS